MCTIVPQGKKDASPHLLIGIIIYYIAKLNKILYN